MKRAVAGLLAVGLAAGLVAACARTLEPPEWQRRQQKMTEITTLWAQIREWRRAAHMELDPTPADMFQWRGRPVSEAAKVCPDGHAVPASGTCGDVCNFAEAICDNAEAICGIADELGKADRDAQDKCASAKASCREAKQRCCNCSEPAP
ncbi:MAG: hypothetical protein E6J91_20475 [Deltaproteobacteria bacterium]|nr:MAG: hypothetical protein E6J91_20475 [Deltaproteobacteria bacterium]